MKKIVNIGTRKSQLAIAQTKIIISEIKSVCPEIDFNIIGISTKGDQILNQSLDKFGGKGLFIKELEQALLDERIDMAIHSMKDMPIDMPDELFLAGVSKREDPRDVLITNNNLDFYSLPKNATIGTSSLRRSAQIYHLRNDIKFKILRGNVISRLEKLGNNEFDGIVLAAAGLKRLGLYNICKNYFSIEELLPAIGQGVLGIQTRKDFDISFIKNSIHHEETYIELEAERAYMLKLNGGCTTPIAAYAKIINETIEIIGIMASNDRKILVKKRISGNKNEGYELGIKLAEKVLKCFNSEEV